MLNVKRFAHNPILSPHRTHSWEAEAVFNGCPVQDHDKFRLVYRALSTPQNYYGIDLELSTIGCAQSNDGINFTKRRLLIKPEYDWEKFGCEDPRVTKINGQYYIFYTAISTYPPRPESIKVGVAITENWRQIKEKHQVTDFNSKGMALFPEKINGKLAAVLTVDTDKPPAKIALAYFSNPAQIWSKKYWDNWYRSLNNYTIPLQRDPRDHIEVGGPPLKTKKGWLLIYCYIKNYTSPPPTFAIEAILLYPHNPIRIIGRIRRPLLLPQETYELYGKVPNVIFPSGALIQDKNLHIYYGAADTTCCVATVPLNQLLAEMTAKKHFTVWRQNKRLKLERFEGNPIIAPNSAHKWEAKAVFNAAAAYEKGEVHIIYRAMGQDNTSVLGYAASKDGIHIYKRLARPIYLPRKKFEKKLYPGNSGCEDPRITKIGGRFYMCYTAYNGKDPAHIAFASIKTNDFLHHNWRWKQPILISPPEDYDKDSCLLPEKINNKFIFFHRLNNCIWIDSVNDLNFNNHRWLGGKVLLRPGVNKWDSQKIGIGGPPLKTKKGWLLIYHGLSQQDGKYRLGAVLLDLSQPDKIISKLNYPLLEPETNYENNGLKPGTVFTCGTVIIKDKLFVYYGAADQVIGVAFINLSILLAEIIKTRQVIIPQNYDQI